MWTFMASSPPFDSIMSLIGRNWSVQRTCNSVLCPVPHTRSCSPHYSCSPFCTPNSSTLLTRIPLCALQIPVRCSCRPACPHRPRPWVPRTSVLAYSESKYRLWIFPPQRWGRDFAHARSLPSFIVKPQTPMREKQIVFTYCSVRLRCSRWSSARRLWNKVCYRFFWMQDMWNRLIFVIRYVKYTVKMSWVMEWWGNGLESPSKVVITCMTNRGAAGRLWSVSEPFYEEGIQKLVPRYDKCFNNGGNYVGK
jgi:hypothetical protein